MSDEAIARINCTYVSVRQDRVCHFFVDVEELPQLSSVCYDYIIKEKKEKIRALGDEHSPVSHVWNYYADSVKMRSLINEDRSAFLKEYEDAEHTSSEDEFVNLAIYFEDGHHLSKRLTLSGFHSCAEICGLLESLVPEDVEYPSWFRKKR